jgi:insertion element IS1 protein InsB
MNPQIELDELHTFVFHKRNPVWIWLALCRGTRRVLAYHIGDRRDSDARHLYEHLPESLRQQADFFSDRYVVYRRVLPPERHSCRGKVTNHVERLNLTLRQRVAPLVRRTLSFAKTLTGLQHRLAFFLNHYNHSLS